MEQFLLKNVDELKLKKTLPHRNMSPGMTVLKWEKNHNAAFNSFELLHKNLLALNWSSLCICLAYHHNIFYILCKHDKLIKTWQCYLLNFVSVLILTGTGRVLFIYLIINNIERRRPLFISPIKCRWPRQENDNFSFGGYQQLFLAMALWSSGGGYQRQRVWQRGEQSACSERDFLP